MRILIAEPSHPLVKAISKENGDFELEFAKDGPECLKKIKAFSPELLVVDLMLPKMHGIEILKVANIPTIVTSSESMLQNYHAAITNGAIFFLNKPYEVSFLFKLFERFSKGKLKPEPFSGQGSSATEGKHCYLPRMHVPGSFLKFWGSRGSSPVSGPSYTRFGGNTSCLEVRNEKDLIIIDAGTGIRSLGKSLLSSDHNIYRIFISHTHWDHIAGFPFFGPLYQKESRVEIYAPVGYDKSVKDLFYEMLAYSYFPVRLDDISAKVSFHELRDGDELKFGSIKLQTHYAFHPGATLCFKIQINGQSFGYVTDNEALIGYHGDPAKIDRHHPLLEPHLSFIDFFEDCHTLIHEAQYSPTEYQKKVGWGHSSVSNAAVLLKYCKSKEWIVTHHDPSHADEELQKKFQLHCDIVDHLKIPCRVRMAFDEFVIPL